jgi:hypothetical protein
MAERSVQEEAPGTCGAAHVAPKPIANTPTYLDPDNDGLYRILDS